MKMDQGCDGATFRMDVSDEKASRLQPLLSRSGEGGNQMFGRYS